LTQLLDGSKVEIYCIPVKIKAELRKYQQEGVNWLAFLAKYHLHGILCDGELQLLSLPSVSD
jgi:TATA-binding protein-associated factor